MEIEASGETKIKKDEFSINVKSLKKVGAFFSDKRVITGLIILFLLALVIVGVLIRTQNLPLLKDVTTGEYLPVALDPFYFLRISETMVNGGLPQYDAFRVRPNFPVEWSNELTPKATVFLYKFLGTFSENLTLRHVNVISPVIFFALSIILFFFLILKLTKSKIAAVLGSIFLTIMPSYLYRTMSGFSDHESIGMLFFFAVLLMFVYSMKKIYNQGSPMKKIILFGSITGLLTAFAQAAWGGGTKFIFMIIPVSFFLIWIIRFQKIDETAHKRMKNYFVFYVLWIVGILLFSSIIGYPISKIIGVMIAPSSIMTFVMVLFMISDYLISKNKIKFVNEKYIKKFRIIFSFVISLIVGSILLLPLGFNVFSLFGNLVQTLIRPFGGGRVGSTVAENAQPYLTTWIGQVGKIFLWLFYFGMLFVGIEFSKGFSKKKNKIGFSVFWIILISGILFSRVSQSALFNGDNFISKLFYFGSLLLFVVFFVWTYFKDKLKVKNEFIVMMVWAFFVLIAGRSAVRLFFLVTPLICLMSAYCISRLFSYSKKSKDDLMKTVFVLVLILALVLAVVSTVNLAKASVSQAKSTGPSANYQWQQAMSWVRENTPQDSIFVHWWDYGYWVEYLGQRPTLADGGHFQGDFRTHMIGRYVLTNPDSNSALSFMKSNDVSYLLIDPTDLGKYSAYSSIGSGIDETANDRYSWLPVIPLSPSQTQETRDGILRVYQGGTVLDTDIIYNQNGSEVFLPAGKAGFAGFLVESTNTTFSQPKGVFVYNNQQITLPVRYLYVNGQLMDFKKGVESTIMIVPSFSGSQIEQLGAAIYMSEKTMDSLFAQLYLMNDPKNLYPTVKIAHSQDNQITAALKAQNVNIGEFVYYGGTLQGPIKIWKVDYPTNILDNEEYRQFSGEYASLDDLTVTN